jgi:hypothetical protein
VLFCTPATSIEEVALWMRRCFDGAKLQRAAPSLFALAYADALTHDVQLDATTVFAEMISSRAYRHARAQYRLVFLCSQPSSLIVDVFRKHERIVTILPQEVQCEILANVFPPQFPCEGWHNNANYVKAYASDKVGLGKTFAIHRDVAAAAAPYVSIPVAAEIQSARLVELLRRSDSQLRDVRAFHLNLFGGNEALDILLFQLLVLNDILDEFGRHFCIGGWHVALCPVQFWSAKRLKWSIVTRAHVPRQARHLPRAAERLQRGRGPSASPPGRRD